MMSNYDDESKIPSLINIFDIQHDYNYILSTVNLAPPENALWYFISKFYQSKQIMRLWGSASEQQCVNMRLELTLRICQRHVDQIDLKTEIVIWLWSLRTTQLRWKTLKDSFIFEAHFNKLMDLLFNQEEITLWWLRDGIWQWKR